MIFKALIILCSLELCKLILTMDLMSILLLITWWMNKKNAYEWALINQRMWIALLRREEDGEIDRQYLWTL